MTIRLSRNRRLARRDALVVRAAAAGRPPLSSTSRTTRQAADRLASRSTPPRPPAGIEHDVQSGNPSDPHRGSANGRAWRPAREAIAETSGSVMSRSLRSKGLTRRSDGRVPSPSLFAHCRTRATWTPPIVCASFQPHSATGKRCSRNLPRHAIPIGTCSCQKPEGAQAASAVTSSLDARLKIRSNCVPKPTVIGNLIGPVFRDTLLSSSEHRRSGLVCRAKHLHREHQHRLA